MIGTCLAARDQVAPLHALFRVREGTLECALGDRDAFEADRKARDVHHDEHVFEAAVFLADEIADRLVEHEHRGRARMDTELVLDRRAGRRVALAERAVRVHQELRHDEQRNSFYAFGRGRRAREHQVHDVLRKVVLAVGDEDLLPGDEEVIALRLGARANEREVRSRPAARSGSSCRSIRRSPSSAGTSSAGNPTRTARARAARLASASGTAKSSCSRCTTSLRRAWLPAGAAPVRPTARRPEARPSRPRHTSCRRRGIPFGVVTAPSRHFEPS
jgi:hypothetical protein